MYQEWFKCLGCLLLMGSSLLSCQAQAPISRLMPQPTRTTIVQPPTLTYVNQLPPPTLRPATAQPTGLSTMSTLQPPVGTALTPADWHPLADLIEREAGMAPATITALAFQPQGELLAAGAANGDVRLWRVPTASSGGVLRGYAQQVWRVAFSPDGQLLAVGTERGILVWRVAAGRFDWQLLQTIPASTPSPFWFVNTAVLQVGPQAWQVGHPTALPGTPAATPTCARWCWDSPSGRSVLTFWDPANPNRAGELSLATDEPVPTVWASDSTGQWLAVGRGAVVVLWGAAR